MGIIPACGNTEEVSVAGSRRRLIIYIQQIILNPDRRHFQFPIRCDVIVRHLRRDGFHLLTEEIQLRIRETDLFTCQIQEFLFYCFNGIVRIDSLGEKDDIQFIFNNRLDFVFTKYCLEEGILSLLDEDVVDIYHVTFIGCEFYIAIEYV